jgi:hypothetical protein
VTDSFDRHAAERDAVADYMQTVAHARIPVAPHLPDPAVLWLKAQILKRWDAEQRAQAPLDVMEPVQMAVALMAAVVLFAMSLPSLMRVLAFLRG